MFNKFEMIKIIDELFIQSKKYYNDFNEADGKIGDGDLGITIQNGFQEIINNKDNFTDDLGHNFMICSQAFVKKSGSSFGTLVAFCLMNISKSLKGKNFLTQGNIMVPQVGYSASSPKLSNQQLFIRTVPNDILKAKLTLQVASQDLPLPRLYNHHS